MNQVIQKQEQLKEAVGVCVGGSTCLYGIIHDIAHWAEQIGIIAGATLSLWLLADKVYRTFKRRNAK